jgi:hypothetical protein
MARRFVSAPFMAKFKNTNPRKGLQSARLCKVGVAMTFSLPKTVHRAGTNAKGAGSIGIAKPSDILEG